MNPNTLCKLGLAYTLLISLTTAAQQSYNFSNTIQAIEAKYTGGGEGPGTLAPINPQSNTLIVDIEKSFNTMEQNIEAEYAKLVTEAKADLLATYERIKVIDQREVLLKSQKEKNLQQIEKLQASSEGAPRTTSNNSKIAKLQKDIVEIDKNLVHCRDNRALLKNQLGQKEADTESLLAQLDMEKQNSLNDLKKQRDLITRHVKSIPNISSDALPAYKTNLANHMNVVQKNYDWQIRARKVNGGYVVRS